MSLITSREISDITPEMYLPFSAYVIQTRALPDARDNLKTGGRYILWAQYFNKNTFDKNRKKGADINGFVMHWNPHGDAGIYKSLVRMAKPFAMRYLLEDAKGHTGTMTAGDDHAQPRYLELRSSEIANEFTKLVKKGTVDEWKMNFTQEDQYPAVFPTLFPNFVNGNTGIGVGCVSNIPSFNLSEAIASLKKLVINRDISYDDIYIAPDFPTGGILINADEVKESLRTGRGAAAKLRAVIEYNEKENALEVKQIPYQKFTDTIMGELNEAVNEGRIAGIKHFYDGTDDSSGDYGTKIVIYLNKGVNVERICKQLYKETSLQSSFTICQLMLENGVKPRLYGLKDMMLAYLDHAMSCLRKSYNYDIDKIKKAIEISEGLLIAIAHINKVVEIITKSEDESVVEKIFSERYGLSKAQTSAILDLKLQKLMKLEAIKIEKKLNEQEAELADLCDKLEHFNDTFIAELDRIDKKWGDARRTQVMNLNFSSKDDDAEPIEEKQLLIYYTNLGNLYTQESTTLLRTRRGTKGSKIKLAQNEVIEEVISDSNLGTLLAFTNKGQMYHISTSELPVNSKINIEQLFELSDEKITALTTVEKNNSNKYYTFITKQGMIKKTSAAEYNSRRGKSIKAINLKDDDEVVSVLFTNEENVGILTNNGNFIIIETNDIAPVGRAAQGIRAIKLSLDDFVIDSKVIKKDDKFVVVVSKNGLIKKTLLYEYPINNRNIKGKRISDIKEGDRIEKFLTLGADCDIIIVSERKTIKISTSEIRELSRAAVGVKSISLEDGDYVKDLRGETSGS